MSSAAMSPATLFSTTNSPAPFPPSFAFDSPPGPAFSNRYSD